MKYSEVITIRVPKQKVYPRVEADIYLGGSTFRNALLKKGYLSALPDMGLKQEYYDVEEMDRAVTLLRTENARSMSASEGERRA